MLPLLALLVASSPSEEVELAGHTVVLRAAPEVSWSASPIRPLVEGEPADLGRAILELDGSNVVVSGVFDLPAKVRKHSRPHEPRAFAPDAEPARPKTLRASALKKGVLVEVPAEHGSTVIRVVSDWRGTTFDAVSGWSFELAEEPLTVVDTDLDGAASKGDLWVYGERGVGVPAHATAVSGSTVYEEVRLEPPATLFARSSSLGEIGADGPAYLEWNELRKDHGVPPGVYDAERSGHCRQHAEYLRDNGLRGHDEDPSVPGYTPEGRQAGMTSCITYTGRDGAVERFLRTLYHRSQLIDPRHDSLQLGGAGKTYLFGGLQSRPAPPGSGPAGPQLFPAPGSTLPDGSYRVENPRHPALELSSTLGAPVTCRFLGRGVPVPVEAELFRVRGDADHGRRGEPVPSHLSYPGRGAPAGYEHLWATVALTPLEVLASGVYEADFLFEGGQRHRWRFEIGR